MNMMLRKKIRTMGNTIWRGESDAECIPKRSAAKPERLKTKTFTNCVTTFIMAYLSLSALHSSPNVIPVKT